MNCTGDVSPWALTAEQHQQGAMILVVDDDDEIRELICDYLTGMGYRTRHAANGREMWHRLDDSVDLVILDLMLPGEDGLSLCRALRYRGNLPVIMISARGASSERIIGLEIGADDYLCKPFEPRELLARLRAVLRRGQPGREYQPSGTQHAQPQRLETQVQEHAPLTLASPKEETERYFCGWRLDLRIRRLHSPHGHHIDLTRSDFMVLDALSECPHRIISRDELSRRAFGREHYVNDRAVDVCISRLRGYLEDDARRPRFIRTIRNEGYLLELSSAPE